MKYKRIVHQKAVTDIQNAIQFYSSKNPTIKKLFISELNQAMNLLEINPYFQIRYGQTRCLPLKKFPFLIHYTISEGYVFIHAVTHTSKNPEDWPMNA